MRRVAVSIGRDDWPKIKEAAHEVRGEAPGRRPQGRGASRAKRDLGLDVERLER